MAAKIDESVWALHVWRSPDGNEHPQWTGYKDPRLCRCGERHRLSDAASRLICIGVAHYEGERPCELCGLGWRIPATVAIRAEPPAGNEWINASGHRLHEKQAGIVILDGDPGVNLMEFGVPKPRAPLCVYCMVLKGSQNSIALAHHRAQAHYGESK